MTMNMDVILSPETGIIAFISFLWGNGAISRFISRVNQFLLLFTFLITFFSFVNSNRVLSAKLFLAFLFIIASTYIYFVLDII